MFFNTADLLIEAGHEVVFFSYRDEKNISVNQSSYFINRGGRVKQIRSYFYNKEAAQQLEHIISVEQPDIVHVHLFWGGISSSILKILNNYNIPVVHTAHDYRMVCPAYLLKDGKGNFCERCKGGRFYNCALHRCSKGNVIESLLMSAEMYYRNHYWHPADKINGIIFVSNFSKNKHIEFDGRFNKSNSIVLYNCPSENVKDSIDLSQDYYENYYLFYGRLSEEKGISTLIKAFEFYPHLKLKIVGTGPLDLQLKDYCKERGLANIEFLGYKTGKELFDLVAKAKYVCVPSECYENNPMTIVESYSLSTPVIGAAIGGISEIVVDGKTGYTFVSGSVNSLKTAIAKASELTRDDYSQQRQKAYCFGINNFSRESHITKLLEFYNELINERKMIKSTI